MIFEKTWATIYYFFHRTDGRAQCGLWMLSCVISAILTTTVLVFTIRRTLRLLLSWQGKYFISIYVNKKEFETNNFIKFSGWMFMSRQQMKKPPFYFKLWALCVHKLSSLSTLGRKCSNTGKAMLYSYQGSLPSLPVPPIKKTLAR